MIVTNDHLLSFQRHQDGQVSQPDTYVSESENNNEVDAEHDNTNGYLVTGSSQCGESPAHDHIIVTENNAFEEHNARALTMHENNGDCAQTHNSMANITRNEVGETSRSRSRSRSLNGSKK